MRKLSILACFIAVGILTSCNSYLNVNSPNPNVPTTITPELLLPAALVASANVITTYNSYGAVIGGYIANGGGYGGFSDNVYRYTSGSYSGNWSSAYLNLEAYQQMLNLAQAEMEKGDSTHIYYYAIARVMRAYNFQLLVDCYNNVPYSEAFQGADNVTPKYDDAATIYKQLGDELDEAAKMFRRGPLVFPPAIDISSANLGVTTDAVGEWHRLANTLKLKLMVRAFNAGVTFTTKTFDNAGFLTDDFMLNPGFQQNNNRQNPMWNTWAYSYTNVAANQIYIPTTYAFAFYNGDKLKDTGRGAISYYKYPSTATNQLANNVNVSNCPPGTYWYIDSDRGTNASDNPGGYSGPGILKGPTAGIPLFTAAESYFLQAEAVFRGMSSVSGSAGALFDNGIQASFKYLYTNADGATLTGDPATDATNYKGENDSTALVYYDAAVTAHRELEAIITQKWIALNMIHSHEGWNEYRRTGFPISTPYSPDPTQQNPRTSFAAQGSSATAADGLPTRVPYPTSEINYNIANVPLKAAGYWYTSKIFWAK